MPTSSLEQMAKNDERVNREFLDITLDEVLPRDFENIDKRDTKALCDKFIIIDFALRRITDYAQEIKVNANDNSIMKQFTEGWFDRFIEDLKLAEDSWNHCCYKVELPVLNQIKEADSSNIDPNNLDENKVYIQVQPGQQVINPFKEN